MGDDRVIAGRIPWLAFAIVSDNRYPRFRSISW